MDARQVADAHVIALPGNKLAVVYRDISDRQRGGLAALVCVFCVCARVSMLVERLHDARTFLT
eukprot:2154637-Amphidinium_carterae.1